MDIPSPAELLDSVHSLPAGRPLLDRLSEQPGVYLVGGAVRDLLLGNAPTDLDLMVEGEGERLVNSLGGQVTRHERFGTWTVRLDGFSYDIAQARNESYARPGALPDVTPGTVEEDLRRRDFTVNALAVALGGPEPGTIRAAPGALEDLECRRLRILHDQSFRDDPTRLLRLARYSARLGFSVEPHTGELAAEAVSERALDSVSGARVGAELRLLAAEARPLEALITLRQLGLTEAIHPRFGLVQEEDLRPGQTAISLLGAQAPRGRLVLGLATREIPARELHALLDHLSFVAEDRDVIVATATEAEEVARGLAAAQRPSEVAEVAQGRPLEVVALAGALGDPDKAREWLEDLRHVRLEIAGADLLQAGISQGPAVGRGLQAALSAKLDGRAEGRDAELAVALEAAQDTG